MSKPQRRKGNAKSASSAQAAAFLERTGFSTALAGFESGASNVFEVASAAKAGELCRTIDQDLVLVIRKLSKKDHQTREKGLRDLLSYLKEKDQEMVEACYSHYVLIMGKLMLDGSPTVRMLSLRLTSFFISTLKKAAEKHLKLVIPFVLIGVCDASLSVANQAELVLSENFPGDKNMQVISIFAVDTMDLAVEIIAGRHTLVQPQRYDCLDSPDQRHARLTAQCLFAISRLAPMCSCNEKLGEAFSNFIVNTTVIKSLIKGSALVKSALLEVCIKAADCAQVFNNSQIVGWIISNLDSQDYSVCKKAFEALVSMASDKRFHEKFNVNKNVMPKILSVVRKKGMHWRYASRSFLPTYAILLPRVIEKPKFISSFLESFLDNLPFEDGNFMQCWMDSFIECMKYTHSQEDVVIYLPHSTFVDFIIRCINVVQEESLAVQEKFVTFLFWILNKDTLPTEHKTFLLDSLQLTLIGKRPRSNMMCILLITPAYWCIRNFHVALLRNSPLLSDFVKPLTTCTDDYLAYVDKNISLISALSKEVQSSSFSAQVVLRILRKYPSRSSELDLSSSEFILFLLDELSPEDWPMLSSNMVLKLIPHIKEFIAQCHDERNCLCAIKLLKLLKPSEREEVVSSILGKPLHFPFIREVMACVELPEHSTAELSRLSFLSLFHGVADNEKDIVLDLVRQFPPNESFIRNVISSLFECSCDGISPTDYPSTRLERIGLICSQLLSDQIYVALLPSQDELSSMLTALDCLVSCDIIACCGFFADPFCNKVGKCTSEEEQLRFIDVCAKKSLIYLNINCQDSAHDVSLAYAATVVPVIRLLYNTRWRLYPLTDTLCDAMNQWDQTFQKTASASSRAISTLLSLPTSFSSAQMALRHMRDVTHPGVLIPSWVAPEKKVAWYWALQCDCTDLKLDFVERWITRFHFDSHLKFLSLIHQHIQSDASEWEDSIFNATVLNTSSWRISCLCIVSAIDVINETTLSSLSPDLLDFILCGVVTAIDSCDERTEARFEDTTQYESLAGLSLKLFSKLSDLAVYRYNNSFDREWPDFFFPALSRVVIRWYSLLKSDTRVSFFVHNLVNAVNHVMKLPANLSLKKKLCPELDKLGYADIHQTLIIHSENLLLSENIFIRFAALHMLKILSPIMYKQENSIWMEEDKVTLTAPRHLVVPETLARLITETTGWPAIMAFDCALVPLVTCFSSEEERMVYCNELLQYISTVLPQILAKCPEDIQKAKERDFFMTESVEFTVDIYEKYAANLLFRALEALPAIVRNWYVGLPNAGMQIVNKYISRYVSKYLIEAELNKVKLANQKHLMKDKLLKIRVVPVSGEVIAEYKVEETTMRLSIVLPSNWPLSVPSIQLDKAIVPSEKAKKWLLQLTAYLFHQNGSIVDGIMMWRRNVDRDVDGVEACTVCMMTIHPTNHQLPKVKCRQCRNKFHSNCLYKWFESSSQSTCPLCRANFM